MRAPKAEEVTAIKAEARKRFGSDRVVLVELGPPFDLAVAIAALDLAGATVYDTARTKSAENTRAALLVERVLWPSQESLDEVRAAPGTCALDDLLEQKYRRILGFDGEGAATCEPLSPMTAPPGFCAPKDAGRAVDALQAAHAGSALYAVSHRSSGLSCVLRQPIADVWGAITSKLREAVSSGEGTLSAPVPYAADLCAWAPGVAPGGNAGAALRAHLDEAPGRAMHLTAPLLAMGGAFAEARASFL